MPQISTGVTRRRCTYIQMEGFREKDGRASMAGWLFNSVEERRRGNSEANLGY